MNRCVDSTLLHVSRDLLAFRPARAHDHSPNALALAQVCPKSRVVFDTLHVPPCISVCVYCCVCVRLCVCPHVPVSTHVSMCPCIPEPFVLKYLCMCVSVCAISKFAVERC